jgi:hypothetical protein
MGRDNALSSSQLVKPGATAADQRAEGFMQEGRGAQTGSVAGRLFWKGEGAAPGGAAARMCHEVPASLSQDILPAGLMEYSAA